jgi:hypothetical protein
MNKQQYKNLNRAFRAMRRKCTVSETLAWIAHYNQNDAYVLRRVYA